MPTVMVILILNFSQTRHLGGRLHLVPMHVMGHLASFRFDGNKLHPTLRAGTWRE